MSVDHILQRDVVRIECQVLDLDIRLEKDHGSGESGAGRRVFKNDGFARPVAKELLARRKVNLRDEVSPRRRIDGRAGTFNAASMAAVKAAVSLVTPLPVAP